ncbi:O-antigen ligase family protein [[Pseudopropionibacterium] massiliense]|uniref:O-antigen ligase family protein n=1 Tax=[Pseudopropionibacterium] massiliense TaxID=2220000 RepID=UPI0013EF3BAC|nr:O-antigen ligase family protein [[Pseudopropionibacterium] massiliense]
MTDAPATERTRLTERFASVDRTVEWMTAVMVTSLVLRIPGSLFATVAIAVLQLLVVPLHIPHKRARLWLWTLVLGTVTSSVALVTVVKEPELVGFPVITATFLLVSWTLIGTVLGQRLARVVITTCYWCFGITLFIGLGEIVTGFRVSNIFYSAPTTQTANSRFEVSAFYPNYNDFSVVLAMFVTLLAVRILFDHTSRFRTILRGFLVVLTTGLVFIQGSRGALLALLVGIAAAVWINLRMRVSSRIMSLLTLVALMAAIAGGMLIWNSPWVQDNSTRERGGVINRILSITPESHLQFWFGWGTQPNYQLAARQNYPGELMDPHNVLLEALIWFGLPVALLFVAFWAQIVWRGAWRLELESFDWQPLASVAVVALMPILGIVPSSTFRYYLIFLFSAAAAAAISTRRTT